MLSNNLPDFDALYTRITPQPLGSLLHHRGHTHTFVIALPLGLVALAVLVGFARRRNWRLTRRDLGWLSALALAGGPVHIALDSSNNYGIHPFWPFYNGWFYGDSVFIIEPWIWAVLVPPLYFLVETRIAKGLLLALLTAILALCFVRELVPRSMAIAVSAAATGMTLAAWRAAPRARVALGVAGICLVTLGFAGVGRAARTRVSSLAASDFPASTTHDLVLTPMPANPLCWSAILIQTEDRLYHARSGAFAVWPSFIAASDCPFGADAMPTAPARRVEAPVRPELRWTRQFSAPRDELAALSQHCVAAAFLRFARAPYWTAERGGARVVGDVRYDRAPDLDFSDVPVRRGARCPGFVPPWTPPRIDLLELR